MNQLVLEHVDPRAWRAKAPGGKGYPLPHKTAYGMWNWEKLWKECGFKNPHWE